MVVAALGQLPMGTAVARVAWVLRVRIAARRCRVTTLAALEELWQGVWPTRLVRASASPVLKDRLVRPFLERHEQRRLPLARALSRRARRDR